MESNFIKNIGFNILTTLVNLLFPLLTFSIVSRIIGAEGIGKVAFVNSFTAYFVLISSLGIPIYGIREVSKEKKDKEKLSKLFTELVLISSILTFISLILYFVIIFYYTDLRKDLIFYVIGGLLILSTPFNTEWFFKGYEDFKAVFNRTLLTKIISLIMVVAFVNSEDDDIIYLFISVISILIAYLWLFIRSIKLVPITLKNLDLSRHIKPLLWMFSTTIAISIYTQLDVVMLGFMSSDVNVGYYTASTKINKIVIGLITSVAVVLMPKSSELVKLGDINSLKSIYNNTLTFLFAVSIPATIGMFYLSRSSILLLSGEGFYPAVITMQILTLLIIPIALSNLFGTQGLVPFGGEKELMLSVLIGGLIDFILNMILIPRYNEIGAAISTIVAEIFVMISTFFFFKKNIDFNIEYRSLIVFIIGGVILSVFSELIIELNLGYIYEILIITTGGGLSYLLTLLIFRERTTISLLRKILKK